MATEFQGKVIRALNDVDQRNMDLLDQVISAANEVAGGDTANVTIDEPQPEGPGEAPSGETQRWDTIVGGGQEASLADTGGVAMLEYVKDAIQTAASNIAGVGAHEVQSKKAVERKLESDDDDEDDDD